MAEPISDAVIDRAAVVLRAALKGYVYEGPWDAPRLVWTMSPDVWATVSQWANARHGIPITDAPQPDTRLFGYPVIRDDSLSDSMVLEEPDEQ